MRVGICKINPWKCPNFSYIQGIRHEFFCICPTAPCFKKNAWKKCWFWVFSEEKFVYAQGDCDKRNCSMNNIKDKRIGAWITEEKAC